MYLWVASQQNKTKRKIPPLDLLLNVQIEIIHATICALFYFSVDYYYYYYYMNTLKTQNVPNGSHESLFVCV